jgi:hypothetical protein
MTDGSACADAALTFDSSAAPLPPRPKRIKSAKMSTRRRPRVDWAGADKPVRSLFGRNLFMMIICFMSFVKSGGLWATIEGEEIVRFTVK